MPGARGPAAMATLGRAGPGTPGQLSFYPIKNGAAHGRPTFQIDGTSLQFGTALFGFGGNAASVIVPRRRSIASLSARSSFSSGGT
jgi:hypothetical protein